MGGEFFISILESDFPKFLAKIYRDSSVVSIFQLAAGSVD